MKTNKNVTFGHTGGEIKEGEDNIKISRIRRPEIYGSKVAKKAAKKVTKKSAKKAAKKAIR